MGYANQARIQEAHRAAQAKLQALVAADTARVFPLLDINNLDKSFAGYVQGMETIVNARRTVSASLGASCFDQIRKDVGITDVFTPALNAAVQQDKFFTSMLVTGPISIKQNLAKGMDVAAAREAALRSTIRANQRHVADGGRGTIINAVKRDKHAKGWARLTDGKPCAFCALLASRGPVYKSEQTSKFRSHDGCGCTAVPVFDLDAPWPGRGEEFRKAYDENISGRYAGGDGNNEAVQAWRKFYNESFDVGTSTPAKIEVAKAIDVAVDSSPDWVKSWEQAAAALPENRARVGRIGGRDLTAAEAAELAETQAAFDYTSQWSRRFRAGDAETQAALIAEYEKRTGKEITRSAWGAPNEPFNELAASQRKLNEFDSIVKGKIDEGPNWKEGRKLRASTGETANAHLDAVLNSGKILGDELDSRIAARVRALGDKRPGWEAVVKEREDIEKEILNSNARLKEIMEKLTKEAEAIVDAAPPKQYISRSYLIESTAKDIARKSYPEVRELEMKLFGLNQRLPKAIAKEAEFVGEVKVGTNLYSQIQYEETMKILSTIREMGGEGAEYLVRGTKETQTKLLDAMSFAHRSYPSKWMQKVREKFPRVDLMTSGRGGNTAGTKIELSSGRTFLEGDVGYHTVAVHELGHSMERAIPGLREMEWAFHNRRSTIIKLKGPEFENRAWLGQGYSRKEQAVADNWRVRYSGKRYGEFGDSQAEILTTGVESLLGGDWRYFYNKEKGFDAEFRNFILGVLSVL